MREKPKIGKITKSELPNHLSVLPKYETFDLCSTNEEFRMQTLHSCDLSMSLSDETQDEVLLHVKGSFNNYIQEDVNMNKYCLEEIEKDGRVVKAKACILKYGNIKDAGGEKS